MRKIQTKILALDYILTGTINKKMGPCGKANCRCSKGKDYWHGPYYLWTRKENGKTITKSLSPNQALFCKKAIDNTRKINALITKWRELSLKEIENI